MERKNLPKLESSESHNTAQGLLAEDRWGGWSIKYDPVLLLTHSKKLEVYDPGLFRFCCILSSVIDCVTVWLNDFRFFFIQVPFFLWQKNVGCCPPSSSGSIASTFPLLLIVLEGRVPLSTPWLYQPQLWNPGSALRTLLLKMGDGEMQITKERNVAVCITPKSTTRIPAC